MQIKPNHILTIITIINYVVGYFTNYHFSVVILFMAFLFYYKKTPFLHLDFMQILKINTTCLLMGYFSSISIQNIRQWQLNSFPQVPTTSVYFLMMTLYHYGQFQMVNNFHYHQVNWKSFIIYHSVQYTIANTVMILEHLVTKYYFKFQYKYFHVIMYPAFFIALIGLFLRIFAQFTCKSNFTHLVQYQKRQNHQLVTTGVYSIFRHPAYTGYFYFTTFSQIFLGNIISSIGFTISLIKFFKRRIKIQEGTLRDFFPNYEEYSKKTKILIPFVKQHYHQD